MMADPFDPNNQDSLSLSNLVQRQNERNGDLNRSYYSLGSSSSSDQSINNSQSVLNHSLEVNISELPINDSQNYEREGEEENIDSNINSPNGDLNRNAQNVSSMINFFANSPYFFNSPTMGEASGNEVPTNRFIHSYRNRFENDFHRYFDDNGNLRENPIDEDTSYYEGSREAINSSETPLIDYRGRRNIYYEDMRSPTMRRNRPGLSTEMALLYGNSSEIIATILGAESREIRHELIFSLIRGVLAVRWQQEHDRELINNYNHQGGREEEEERRVLYNMNDHDDEEDDYNASDNSISQNDAARTSSTIRYRINQDVGR